MKKIIIVTITTVLSVSALAENQLTCWNLYSKKGAKPFLTATIVRDDVLDNIKLNQDPNGLVFDTKGLNSSASGSEIRSSRSPYDGQQEFILADGIRLILPTNLDPEAMADASFKGGNLPPNLAARQNGVLDVVGSRYSPSQGGNGYTRMHCVSQ